MCVYTRSAAAGGRTYASALCVYVLLSSLYKYGDYKSAKKELSLSLSLPGLFLVGCRARRAAAADSVQLLSFSSISFAAEQVERWNYMDSIVY